MSIDTKKLIASNFFNESDKLAKMLKEKKHLSDLENNWVESYDMLKGYYDSMKAENYLIIGPYVEEPIGICTSEGLKAVYEEETNSTFIKISEEEATLFSDSDGEILPHDWKRRIVFSYSELMNP